MALSKIHLGRALGSNTIGSAKITDGTLVNADFANCAAVAQSKTATGSTTEVNNATFNVALSLQQNIQGIMGAFQYPHGISGISENENFRLWAYNFNASAEL